MACCTPAGLDQPDTPLWHLILAEADPNQPPTLEYVGAAVEVRHANGAYFVRDTFPGSILAAHRQKLTPEAFASLDTTARHNGIDQSGAQSGPPTPAQIQKHLPEMIANLDSTALDQFQKLPPEAFASLDPITLAILQKLRPEAFANLDSTALDQLPKLPPEASESRGIFKWEKNRQLWVALGTEYEPLGCAHPPDSDGVRAGKAAHWPYFFALGRRPTR